MTLLEMSLSGAAFVLAIAAFRAAVLRRLPKGTFVALWWLAALRLLLPVELASRFSVYTLLEALGSRAEAPALPAPSAVSAAPAAAPPVLIVPARPAEAPPAPFPLWTALWLAVGLLLAAWFLIRYVRWRRRFREALPADGPGLEARFRLRRKVRVRVTDQIDAPLTYGLLRPVILLPRSLDLSDRETLACVLAHEEAHIRRLDGLLKLALTAVFCLHWFNPAVWLLYVLGNRDMELRCDEAAVLALGEDSRERYALALLRLAENKCAPLCGFACRNGMEERIKAIMSVKRKSLPACFIALALVLGITTAFATSAKPGEADGPLEPSDPWNGDMIDRELRAQSSAESAAQWKEVLAPYEPLGLKWAFDDPDLDGNGLSMTFEGREVSGIYDEKQGLWITEHTGNGAYGPDAVELYTVYEDGKLSGLRLATEEEQARFARDRKLSSDTFKVELLAESVRYEDGQIYFTVPESEEPWSIFIRGRVLTEDGAGMSVHYLEEESERAEWVPGQTYSFEAADAAYDELTMEIAYGNACYSYPLAQLLPEGGGPLPREPLPEGKEDIPEGAEMIWPVDGGRVTNSFGERTKPGGEGTVMHNGVDIGGMAEGAPVYAAGKGTVKEAGFSAENGNYVRLDHGNGLETFYAHCQSLRVKTGGTVELGQTIAAVGSTGASTGPHLHFEVSQNGVLQNPEIFYQMNEAPAAPAGREGTDIPGGASQAENRVTGLKSGSGREAAQPQTVTGAEIEQYYEAGNLPLFQMAFSRLDAEAQGKWLEKIYADWDIAFMGAVVNLLDEDCTQIQRLAETVYKDGDVAFFSNLAMHMSKDTLEGWLDRALEDEKWAFQSVLFNLLGRDGEFDEREKEWEEAQAAEYGAVGITVDGKNRYYQGQLVNVFLDARANKSFYTLDMNPAGAVSIKVVRNADNEITGVAYMTEAEMQDLFG